MTSSLLLAREEDVAEAAARIGGRQVAGLAAVAGGRNNRVYRVDFRDGCKAALKVYPSQPGETRDRLRSEYEALTFLAAHAPGWTPAPIGVDHALRIAAYEWIDGAPITGYQARDLERAIGFAARLKEVSTLGVSLRLPEAAEAILSLGAAVGQVRRRLESLDAVAADEPDLDRFLNAELGPLFTRTVERAEAGYAGAGLDVDAAIADRQRTLSPSDFGFHNAIRRPDGTVAFVDLEYFGWDDPVKLTADFVQHPGMSLDERQRADFVMAMGATFSDDALFLRRLAALAPLIGLRWCLIMLNEFLPEAWQRRLFVGGALDHRRAKQVQLAKARRRLAVVRAFVEGNGSWH